MNEDLPVRYITIGSIAYAIEEGIGSIVDGGFNDEINELLFGVRLEEFYDLVRCRYIGVGGIGIGVVRDLCVFV